MSGPEKRTHGARRPRARPRGRVPNEAGGTWDLSGGRGIEHDVPAMNGLEELLCAPKNLLAANSRFRFVTVGELRCDVTGDAGPEGSDAISARYDHGTPSEYRPSSG